MNTLTKPDPVVSFDADGNPVTQSGRKIGPGEPWPHLTDWATARAGYALGVDGAVRLHGGRGMRVLLEAEAAQSSPNTWDRAAAAVDAQMAANPEVVAVAAGHLLALHRFQLEDGEPSAAMRNVRVGDYVRLHGTKCYVERIVNGDKPTITLKVRLHSPSGAEGTYSYDRDVRIPLIARPVTGTERKTDAKPLRAEVEAAAERIRQTGGHGKSGRLQAQLAPKLVELAAIEGSPKGRSVCCFTSISDAGHCNSCGTAQPEGVAEGRVV